MPVSRDHRSSSPSEPHRQRQPNGYPGHTASLPVEPKLARNPKPFATDPKIELPNEAIFTSNPNKMKPVIHLKANPFPLTGKPVPAPRCFPPPPLRGENLALGSCWRALPRVPARRQRESPAVSLPAGCIPEE